MNRILLGNMISFAAAIMLFLGCYTTDARKIYVYQIAENAILCLSSVVFGSWTGLITLLLAIFRNILIMRNKYSRVWMLGISIVITVGGMIANTKGVVGWLPILATLIWTIGNYYYSDVIHVKIFLLINTIIWCMYFFIIWDFSSGIAQLVTGIICIQSLYRVSRASKKL
ncbi:YgjV family protein [Faecalicatena contorta]|uniref:YgjV family protein n=1 Tax=Faecalicatena contorta TaxID=39482 RepID=UPI001F2DCEFF|nr:YgjV family protein [Faecalicatena contorta]MCF2555549.1 YgjV family protein [Faecalicatena contorta]